MKYFVLLYDVVNDLVARRAPYREEHLRLIREAHARGEIVMSGALGEPPDSALLIFRVESAAPIEAFVRADPYVAHGLVTRWQIKPWAVVAGGQ